MGWGSVGGIENQGSRPKEERKEGFTYSQGKTKSEPDMIEKP